MPTIHSLFKIISKINWSFFTNADSREPELAGVGSSLVGSFFTLFVCLILSFPLGILAAIYLEEFAPKNKITEIIEVNVNNLAAVPSIVFGLLGLGVFLNYFYLPNGCLVEGTPHVSPASKPWQNTPDAHSAYR